MATLRRKRTEEASEAQEENVQTSLGLEEETQAKEDVSQDNPEKVLVRKKRVVKVKQEEPSEQSEAPAAEATEQQQTEHETGQRIRRLPCFQAKISCSGNRSHSVHSIKGTGNSHMDIRNCSAAKTQAKGRITAFILVHFFRMPVV